MTSNRNSLHKLYIQLDYYIRIIINYVHTITVCLEVCQKGVFVRGRVEFQTLLDNL